MHYNLSITIDSICPWCYIGFRRFQRAVAMFQEQEKQQHTFSVTWHPFYLNPDAPKKSIPKTQFFLEKFGPERAKQVVANLTNIGEQEGIPFSFLGRTGNTRDAHRLIAWAGKQEQQTNATTTTTDPTETLQTRVVTELFKSFFEKEEDITEAEILAAAGARAGLSGDKIKELLAQDEKTDTDGEGARIGAQVDAEVNKARREDGISGVPHFVINNRFEVSGAQEPAAFAQLFRRVLTHGQ